MGDIKTGAPSTDTQNSNAGRYAVSPISGNASSIHGAYHQPSSMVGSGVLAPPYVCDEPQSKDPPPQPPGFTYSNSQSKDPKPKDPAKANAPKAKPTDAEVIAGMLQGILKSKIWADTKALGQTLSPILSAQLQPVILRQKLLMGCVSREIDNLTYLTTCDAELYQLMKAMAKDTAAMQAIASNANESMRRALIDVVYPQIEDINIAEIAFHGRFGIRLSSANYPVVQQYLSQLVTEESWTIEAARQLYDIMLKLPPSHVAQIKVITTSNPINGSGGRAWPGNGHIHLRYVGKNDVETGLYTSSKNDKMRGLNLNETTTLHEMAHVLDIGEKYSRTPAFRGLSGWKEYSRADMWKILDTIIENSPKPYPANAKTGEKEFVDMAMMQTFRLGVKKDKADFVPNTVDIVAETKRHFSHTDIDAQSNTRLRNKLERADAYHRCLNAHALAMPWSRQQARSGYKVTKGVHIHEGYEGKSWYSYNHSARASKYSDYQFRTPGEEFAELYAVYHATDGKKVDPARRAWFEQQGLHKDPKTSKTP